jgi:hypothetical protein
MLMELALTCNSEIFGPERASDLLDRLHTVLDSMIENRPLERILECEDTA